MSKNKKLGRGLRELLRQSDNSSQNSSRPSGENRSMDPFVSRETFGDSDVSSVANAPESKSGMVKMEDISDDLLPVSAQSNGLTEIVDEAEAPEGNSLANSVVSSENRVDSIEKNEGYDEEDDSHFQFDMIRGDIKKAAGEVEQLQNEIDAISTRKSFENNGNVKTLSDYMDASEKDENLDNGETNPAKAILEVPGDSTAPQVSSIAVPSKSSSQSGTPSSGNSSGNDADRIYNILIDLIDSNPWQPREVFQKDELAELAESIKTHGFLQPIVVREYRGRYQLVAGERRLRASITLNMQEVPATVIEATDKEMAELALVENLQRKDLNPIEKAKSFSLYLQQNKSTQEELSRRLSLDRSTVANLIRLLSLPEEVQKKVAEEKLTQGHARSLLSLNTTKDQIAMAKRIEDEKLTVRQSEQIVSEWNQKSSTDRKSGKIEEVSAPASNKRNKEKSANILDLERQLQEALDLKVKITKSDDDKGKLEIFFRNQDDFASLLEYFRS